VSISLRNGKLARLKVRRAHRSSQGEAQERELATLSGVLVGIILLSVVFSQRPSAAQLSVDEILNKVTETYRNLQSYQFVAEKRTELAAAGESRSPGGTAVSNFYQSTEGQIELAAVKPGKVRLRVKDGKLDVLLVSDGQTTWTYMPRQKQYSEVLGPPPEAIGAYGTGEDAGRDVLSQYWNLLVGRFRGVSQYISIATLEKDNRVKVGREKIDCYVVKIQTPQLTHEIWVDKSRFIVLRFKQTPLRPQEGIVFQTTITVNMTEADVNTTLEDTLFKFTPPEKATKVLSLSRPDK
jgi:outer membrane lipoprotein-sorting protein